MMIERRKEVRTDVATVASVFFGAKRSMMRCTALDLSSSGGKIALDRLYALPQRFLLSFDHFSSAQNCRLVWAKGNFVGVAFGAAALPRKSPQPV
ncbi:PilZ domain-containing protein [Bradyrhizobium sp.]|uniref:PilZ domain-containing protein n=1 Tax=Bradyrhizobium sp. TaxID=376 RepID=UPI0025C30876|nr:PilZ domain-containing protein [Bradyrhizobium sp.]